MPLTWAGRAIAVAVLAVSCGLGYAERAAAADVPLFQDRVPSVPELAGLLWPEKASPPGGRTRSIWAKDNLDLGPTQAGAGADEPRGFGLIIQFKFDSTEILPESRLFLDRVGQLMLSKQAENRSLNIIGHTDASGSEAYNQKLSEARADAVRGYLMAWYGLSRERLAVAGRGERQPRAGTDPLDPTNRRVEFLAAD